MRVAAGVATVLAFALVAPAGAGAGADGADYVTVRVSNPPAVLGIGAAMRVSDTTRNRGDSPGPETSVRYYLSRDTRRSRGDRLLGGRLVPALGAGRSSRGGATVAIPRVRPGSYHVLACARSHCRASARTVAVKRSAAPEAIWNNFEVYVFNAGDPPRPVAPNATVTDADDAMLRSASVWIERPEPGERLVFEQQLGITGTYDSGTGVLTLRGLASTGAYQQALRSVAYGHDGPNPSSPRTLGMRVQDAVGVDSSSVYISIDVTVN